MLHRQQQQQQKLFTWKQMATSMNAFPIQQLAELLKDKEDESDSEESQGITKGQFQTPGSIGQQEGKTNSGETKYAEKNLKNSCDKSIWDENEIEEDHFDDRDLDSRPSPEYDIMFKQKVTTDDIFLGMSGKNSSTACCEDLLIKIHLPDTNRSDIDLDVQEKFLDCRSPKYRLALHLPHKVDSKNGTADWDPEKSTLLVTLSMDREFDFMQK